jgi:hypothetical protein
MESAILQRNAPRIESRTLLTRLSDAFHAGLSVPARPEPALIAWIDALSVHAQSRLPAAELRIANKCKLLSDTARNAIRGHDQSKACRSLAMANLLSNNPLLSREGHYLCVAEIAPAELYVEHLCRSRNSARFFLSRALDADQSMENDYGYCWKIGHRIHLLTVAAGMSAEQGLMEDAARQTADILSLLVASEVSIGVAGDWHPARLRCLSKGMRDVLAMQALRTFFPFFGGCSREVRNSALRALSGSLTAPINNKQCSDPAGCSVNDYVHLLIDALDQPESYLQKCPLVLGHGGFTSITFSIAFDAACYLAEHYNVRSSLMIDVLRLARSRSWALPTQSQWHLRMTHVARASTSSEDILEYHHFPLEQQVSGCYGRTTTT